MKMQTTARTAGLLTFLILALAFSTDGWAQCGRGGDRTARPQLPTVDEMAAAIDADASQRAALAEARLAWSENRAERRSPRRGGHRGRRGERPTPPAVQFLVDVAPAVDTGDMIALVDLLSENGPRVGRRGDGPGRMRARGHGGRGHGPGHGPRGGADRMQGRGHGAQDMLVHELDLTDDQRAKIDALYAATRGSLRALRGRVGPEQEPTTALEAEAKRIRESHQERLVAILTSEQNDELVRLRAERRAERGAGHAERIEDMRTQRLAHLTAILDLDSDQRAAVENALEAAEQRAMQERAERMAVGGPMPNLFDSGGRRRVLRGETRDTITDVLDPQQRELFATLQTMMLEAGGRGGHGAHRGDATHRGPGGHGRRTHRGR